MIRRYRDAETIQLEGLRIRREIWGERHPKTLNALRDLVITYWALGRLDETVTLGFELLHLYRDVLGDEHLDATHVSIVLAAAYFNLGRYEEHENFRKRQ